MSSSGNFENVSFKLPIGDILGEGNGTILTIDDSAGKVNVQGDLHANSTIYLDNNLTHIGDTNTKIAFATDNPNLYVPNRLKKLNLNDPLKIAEFIINEKFDI